MTKTALCDGITTRYDIVGEGPPLLMYAPAGFDATLENMPHGVALFDKDQRIVLANGRNVAPEWVEGCLLDQDAVRQAARSSGFAGRQPPPAMFSRSTGRSLQTQGTPTQSASSNGSPQPSAIVGNTEARTCP